MPGLCCWTDFVLRELQAVLLQVVSLLLCDMMEPNESIIMRGAEQYSLYFGYANTFQFGGEVSLQTTLLYVFYNVL